MKYPNYKNEDKFRGKQIYISFMIIQSLVFLVGLILGINLSSMVIFASTSLGCTIIVYTLYNKKNSQKILPSL